MNSIRVTAEQLHQAGEWVADTRGEQFADVELRVVGDGRLTAVQADDDQTWDRDGNEVEYAPIETVKVGVPPAVVAAIRAIVAYDWEVEARDYEDQDADDREGHVFLHLQRVQEWLNADARLVTIP